MATYLENLTTARDQCAARLVAITAQAKPSYSVDGQSISWGEYHSMLTEQLSKLNALIQAAQPYIVVSKARS